jgi:hypothetical protein
VCVWGGGVEGWGEGGGFLYLSIVRLLSSNVIPVVRIHQSRPNPHTPHLQRMASLADDPEVKRMVSSAITVTKARTLRPRRSRRLHPIPHQMDQFEELELETMFTEGRGDCIIHAVAGAANIVIEPVECRQNVATMILDEGAARTFDAFCTEGENLAEQAAYIRVPGNWFRSIHIGALAVLVQRSIAVISTDGSPINLYGVDARWHRLTTDELRALMHSSDPPVIVGLDNTSQGLEHFVATQTQ